MCNLDINQYINYSNLCLIFLNAFKSKLWTELNCIVRVLLEAMSIDIMQKSCITDEGAINEIEMPRVVPSVHVTALHWMIYLILLVTELFSSTIDDIIKRMQFCTQKTSFCPLICSIFFMFSRSEIVFDITSQKRYYVVLM